VPPEIEGAGLAANYAAVMEDSAKTYGVLVAAGVDGWAAQYAVSMAHRIRFVLQMNAREAMHILELRSSPQGHPVYRRIAQRMHELIRDQAGHRAIADAMRFVDHSGVELERLDAERRTDARRRESGGE
jgi:thymidylate synthase ThyX